ncbi:hypothetical protein NL64_06135 [Pseudomonas fluorescens]|uniref:DUF1353 domain-containing protein n=1 Tax=Pseudomonas fluorescens TaxID=294 RepID=UPI00054B408C|nr:DUF1353 domain-containing protein [Pseudomonas fluorescens]KII34841.1 hypothetical protein NL64_06135 [Pseudomonas fluorescens]
MSKFLSSLRTEEVAQWDHKLLDELIFLDDLVGVVKVPAGFGTDFASIQCLNTPLLFWLYALLVGYGNKAATVHDYLYRNGKHTRAICDEVFYRALIAEGVPKMRAILLYQGVRIGGGSSYNIARQVPSIGVK